MRIRQISSAQLSLLPTELPPSKLTSYSTFSDNRSVPIHRWFRYSAGFSAAWVRELIQREQSYGRSRIFDPFAGSGTVLLESEMCGANALGLEAHPFIARVARAKLNWRADPQTFTEYALSILAAAQSDQVVTESSSPLLLQCFPPTTLQHLDAFRSSWLQKADGSAESELTWLALISILRSCSPAGTAQWQYVLPNKTKARVVEPFDAIESMIYDMSEDMAIRQSQNLGPEAKLEYGDARDCSPIPSDWAELIITSPPYANNFDYADATRLEMTFMREVKGWGDLQEAVRRHLIRSCTQHVAKLIAQTDHVINNPLLLPIRSELSIVSHNLDKERRDHGGKKPYHTMIANYFFDMAKVWFALRRVAAPDSLVCFVVGDSAPYGIYVPVDRWLGELALAAGFKSYSFEKTRDRNIKWKNRKHRVPLHEGRLWVQG